MRALRGLAVAALVVLPAWPTRAQGAAPAAPPAPAPVVGNYQIDPVHSELTFRVRHLLGRVAGTFRDWGGTVVMDNAKPANSKVNVEIKTASVETLKAEPAADVALAPAAAIRVGGVERGDPGRPRRVQDRVRLGLGLSGAEEHRGGADPAEVAAAEDDARDFDPAAPE